MLSSAPYPHNRGGDRSRSTSDCLSTHQVNTLITAALESNKIGTPFNLFLTVNWTRAGIDDAHAAKATGRLIKSGADWMRARGGWLPWSWVRETSIAGHDRGSHVHILLHAPAGLPLARQFRRWLRRITGQPYRPRTILTRRIGGTLSCYHDDPARYEQALRLTVAYMCKGAPQPVLDAAGLDRQHQPQGRIIGKRAARWQTRAPIADLKARAAAKAINKSRFFGPPGGTKR
jgi:hypothetical protein